VRKPVPADTAYHLINHGPCNLITTGDGARRNVAPINWTMPVSDEPPLVLMAVEPGIFTDELLKAGGEFAVNVMGEKHAREMLFCGRRTGREVDKFKETGLTPVPCARVKPPRLAESLAHLECRVVKTHEYESITLYVGQILHAEAEEGVFDGKTLRPENARTLHHLGGGVFSVTERVVTVPKP
jgi:flavin reductase (DIM6/NTAB) family NADH-FMN oxidoreductase RutF